LEELEIATADAEWVKALLAETGNRRSLALFRLLVNDGDSLAWATLLRTTAGIGDKFIDSVYLAAKEAKTSFAHSLRRSIPGKGRAATLAAALIKQVGDWLARNELPKQAPDVWAEWILQQDLPAGSGLDDACAQLLRDIDKLTENESGLDRFLGQISPLGADLAAARSDGVRIMSLAKSKGLTVRGAIIAGCEEGIIPHESAHPDEEARLMYVGMTRAKEYQYCTWARRRKGPTARVGRKQVGNRRTISSFFLNGPVKSRSGDPPK
jgi:superfamily I DNA/RNA helicase